MRVCLVAPELLPVPPVRGGAIEQWIESVAVELAQRRVDVHVIAVHGPPRPGAGASPPTHGGVTYHHVPVPQILEAYPLSVIGKGYYFFTQVGRIIGRLQPDIAHYHNRPLGVLIAHRWYASSRCRNVLSLHNTASGWCLFAKQADRCWFPQGFTRCDRVLTVSEFIRAYVSVRMPQYPPERLHTLRNGVDTQRFILNGTDNHRDAFGFSPDPLILFAGRIDPRKGVHALFEVLKRVREEVPAAQLAIVGPKGSYWHRQAIPYARWVEAQAKRTPGVHLLDPIYDRRRLARLYAMADVACLPFCSAEGFPLTVIELQACGVPVVTTKIGGVAEALHDGCTGFLVEPGDLNAMADSIVRLLRDRALHARMRVAARQLAEDRFSWTAVTSRLVQHYEALLGA